MLILRARRFFVELHARHVQNHAFPKVRSQWVRRGLSGSRHTTVRLKGLAIPLSPGLLSRATTPVLAALPTTQGLRSEESVYGPIRPF